VTTIHISAMVLNISWEWLAIFPFTSSGEEKEIVLPCPVSGQFHTIALPFADTCCPKTSPYGFLSLAAALSIILIFPWQVSKPGN
jgi:hypothetical protein